MERDGDNRKSQEHGAQGGPDQDLAPWTPCPKSTGLQRKDLASVLDQLGAVIERRIRRRAVGTFTLPGLLKIKVVRKPATRVRKMISSFNGPEIAVAAKPASRAVKVQPLRGLKRMTE